MCHHIKLGFEDSNMSNKLMILPSTKFDKIRLVCIPDDYEPHEAFRKVTGLIAKVEEDNPEYSWDDIASELEESGFHQQESQLGPVLD